MSTPPSVQRLLQVSTLITAVLAGIRFGVYGRFRSILSDGLFNAIDARGEVTNGLGPQSAKRWISNGFTCERYWR